MRRWRGPRTLRGRVSLLALAVIAVWLVVLTIAFNLYLERRLHTQSDAALRVRAQAGVRDGRRRREPARCRCASRAPTAISTATPGSTPMAARSNGRPRRATRCSSFADSLGDARQAGFADLEDDARLYVLPVDVSGRTRRHRRRRAEHCGRAPRRAGRPGRFGHRVGAAARRRLSGGPRRRAAGARARGRDGTSGRPTGARTRRRGDSAAVSATPNCVRWRPIWTACSTGCPRCCATSGGCPASSRTSCAPRWRTSRRRRICLCDRGIRPIGRRIWRSPTRHVRWTASSTRCSLRRAPSRTRRPERARLARRPRPARGARSRPHRRSGPRGRGGRGSARADPRPAARQRAASRALRRARRRGARRQHRPHRRDRRRPRRSRRRTPSGSSSRASGQTPDTATPARDSALRWPAGSPAGSDGDVGVVPGDGGRRLPGQPARRLTPAGGRG